MINKSKFDVVEPLESFLNDSRFVDISRSAAHMRFIGILQQNNGKEVPKDILQHIYNETLMHFLATAKSDEEYDRDRRNFDARVWPELHERLRWNFGAAQFTLECSVHSRYIATCLLDMVNHPALLIPMGHGIGHTVDDRLEAIPMDDAAIRFMKDPSFSLFRFRNKASASVLVKAKTILMIGGGSAFTLIARGYPLGELDQKIVIYDMDAEMPRYLEMMLGCPLEEAGIEYRVADFREVFTDSAQADKYDAIEMLGVAAYYFDDLDELFGGICYAAAPGAKLVFDSQVMSAPTLPFDKVIMGWNTRQGDREMHVDNTVDEAKDTIYAACERNGLRVLRYTVEEIDAPAGVVFFAEKPTP